VQDSRQVALALDEIAALMEFAGAKRFQTQAYERGARIVESVADDLGSYVEQDRLVEIDGIGPSLSRQIQELWNTGESALLARLRSEHPPGTAELMQVEGLTPKRIRALHTSLGIDSVEALREACVAKRVRSVKGFGEKTEERILDAIDRWLGRTGEPAQVLRSEALQLVERLERQLLNARLASKVEAVGALRRGEETVRELELLVVAEPETMHEGLARFPQVARVDREHSVALLARGIPLHLRFASEQSYGVGQVFGTGSAEHLAQLAARASERGLTLTAQGLRGPGLRGQESESESALYQALGLKPIPPELRTGHGELAQAEQRGFERLLQHSDIRGMVHCHTTYSDGKNSIEEMARAAEALGMSYITITDHSPSAHYARGVELDRLKQQWDEIASVQERVSIRILRGTESDILVDGSLDYPDAVLEQLDVVIASIHARNRMDRAQMTARLTRAMALPVFKIWGHALGRILLHRDAIDCSVPDVLDALAGSRGAIELNGDPHRLDLPVQWIPLARERHIPFVVSVDAHSVRGLGALHHGVTQARRGGLESEQVLNTLPADQFAARVRPG
jgi:DNA polymerase (family 10)